MDSKVWFERAVSVVAMVLLATRDGLEIDYWLFAQEMILTILILFLIKSIYNFFQAGYTLCVAFNLMRKMFIRLWKDPNLNPEETQEYKQMEELSASIP